MTASSRTIIVSRGLEVKLSTHKGSKISKSLGISTAVETCGYFNKSLVPKLVKNVDLFLFDLKDTSKLRLKANTGADLDSILENLFAIDRAGGKIILRCIFLKGVNDDNSHLENIVKIYNKLNNCLRVEIFSYHHYGEGKYSSLGQTYLGKKEWMLNNIELKYIANYLKKQNIPCIINL